MTFVCCFEHPVFLYDFVCLGSTSPDSNDSTLLTLLEKRGHPHKKDQLWSVSMLAFYIFYVFFLVVMESNLGVFTSYPQQKTNILQKLSDRSYRKKLLRISDHGQRILARFIPFEHILGGGNSNIFYVHPYPFWLVHIFQMGWFNPPTRKLKSFPSLKRSNSLEAPRLRRPDWQKFFQESDAEAVSLMHFLGGWDEFMRSWKTSGDHQLRL